MSFDYTGSFSGSFSGEIVASNDVISSSAQVAANLPSGVVSASNQIDYRRVQNKPTTISAFQKNSIVANNNFRENTYPTDSASFDSRIKGLGGRITTLENATDETGSDSQTLSFNQVNNQLTISDGNSVDLSTLAGGGGGGSSIWSTGSDYYYVSSDLQVTGSFKVKENVIADSFTGSLHGTADTASFISDTFISASAARSGFGQGGGTSDFTQLTNVPSGLVSGSTQITDVITDSYISASAALSGFGAGGDSIPDGTISSSTQVEAIIDDTYISASAALSGFGQGGGETYTEGLGIDITSEVISLDTSSAHFRLGVSASAALYGFGSGGGGGSFGDPPTFDQDGLQVNEFVASGSTIGTLTVTDVTPGDTATFEIQSAYTDDFFKISSGGVVTANTLVTSSMNTTAGSGSNESHPFLVKVTDGQNNVVEETIYIYVRPNSAPVFRQTSVAGSIITSFTSSAVNENSTDGSTIATIYFTDENSDTITIRTGSVTPADHFNYTINATNVVITQDTASLDYESITSYTLSLTASDEHYESGVDDNSVTTLEIQIPVGDNLAPGVNDQTLTAINENSSNGTVVDSVEASDNESDTITWTTFVLRSAYLNGVGTNVTSSLGGTSLYDPHSNPFQINSGNGQVTRKNGVFLNADIADRYEYEVEVKDIYNTISGSGIITIPIDDDAASSIGTDGNDYYIQEGATQGDNLTTYSNGYTSGNVTFTSAVSQMWEVNSVPSGYVRFTNGANHQTGSSVTLEVDTDISGNLHFVDSDTVEIQITASETSFETTKQFRDHTLTITDNQPYSIVFSDTGANLNSNGARPSNTLTTISFTEPQIGIGDTIDHDAFTLTDPSGQLTTVKSGETYYVRPTSNLSGSTTYDFTASIADSYGNITTDSHSITIAQAGVGTLTENGTFYVIESATNGDNIVLSTNGRSGTQGDLGVTYSPQYNSAAVASFTSSNALISVASNGNLSVGTDISGSGNTDGDTITSNITWQDQFGNAGGPTSITVNITENFAPTATDTPETNNLNTNLGVDGAKLATLTWSDTEGDSLNISSFALSGNDASSLSSSYDGGNTFGIYANGDRSAETLSYTASVEDTHGFSVGTYKDDITIAQADDGTLSVGTLYIIESATNGDGITTDTDGLGSSTSVSVTYSPSYGSPAAQNFSSTSPFIDINSSTGELTVGNDISGSANTSGDTISTTIGWEDQYGNTDSVSVDVNVTSNTAPSVSTDAPNTSNWNTNLAVDGALLAELTWSDTEGDDLDISSFNLTGAGAASLSSSYNGSNTFGIYANGDRSAGTISYTANLNDTHSFNDGTYSDAINIAQAGGGSITSENFYIIESALSGALITNDSDGIGSQADVNVTYSPNYGTQVAEQFNSNHSVIAIDSTGNLSIKSNISGSYQSGDTISPTIYWEDQYGNEGTGSITINITNNVLPSATFVDESVTAPVSSGTKLVTITITDTESDSPYGVTLSGDGADSMSLDPQNEASSSWFINASDSSMTSGMTLNYTASIQDAYGEDVVEYNREFVVGAPAAADPIVYVYEIGLTSTNYNNTLGYQTATNTVPSTISTPTVFSGFGFADKIQSSLGGESLSYSFGSAYTATLLKSGSLTDLYDLSESFGRMDRTSNHRVAIIIPSGSSMSNVPTTMGDGYTSNGYSVLEVGLDDAAIGSGLGTTEQSYIHKITLDSSVNGFDDYIIISTVGITPSTNNILLDIRPDNDNPA
ncbi:hypothetical protein N9W01_00235 [bacterium]|nr:hypothetical protein [bacterium]